MEMIEVTPSRFKLPPYKHQLHGVKRLVSSPVYGLFWKMRLGKSKCVIDTACTLFEAKEIDTLLVVAPAQVKDVWLDKNFGELATHDWSGAKTYDYRKLNSLVLPHGKPAYVVASVEYLRQQGPDDNFPFVDNLLAALAGRSVWFVFDEGSVLGNWKSKQTKAMIELRNGDPIKRVTLLDGTPEGNSHLSYYSKFKLLNKEILGCKSFYHYRARYSETAKVPHKWKTDEKTGERKPVATHIEVIKRKNEEDFARRTAPYCEYLADALDMPVKVPAVLPVALSEKAWKVYCSMRDELVAEIDNGVCAVGHAAVKCIRLAQICAGFLGGVALFPQMKFNPINYDIVDSQTIEVHDAPTEMLMGWLAQRFEEQPDFKCVVWSRFVPEIERLEQRLVKESIHYGLLYGEKKLGHNLLHPASSYTGPLVLVAQPQAAKYGLNLSKADTAVYLSQDYDRVTRSQSEDRIQATGVRKTSLLADVIVTGPRGQKTVVHDIVASVRAKEEAEKRTAQDWKRVLLEE